MFDYSKLRGRIKEKFGTQTNFANAMNISSVSVSDKLNNKISFKQKEIELACKLLEINLTDVPIYFFCSKS